MNWITNYVRPRIKGLIGKGKDAAATPENLWRKCSACGEMIFHRDLTAGLHVCPKCGHHMRIGPAERFAYTFDNNQFQELVPPPVGADPLAFKGEKKYSHRIQSRRSQTRPPRGLNGRRRTLD